MKKKTKNKLQFPLWNFHHSYLSVYDFISLVFNYNTMLIEYDKFYFLKLEIHVPTRKGSNKVY